MKQTTLLIALLLCLTTLNAQEPPHHGGHIQPLTTEMPKFYFGADFGVGLAFIESNFDYNYLGYRANFEHRFTNHWGYEVGLGWDDFYYANGYRPETKSARYLVFSGNITFYSRILDVRMGTTNYLWLTSNNFYPEYESSIPINAFLKIGHNFRISQRLFVEPYIGCSSRTLRNDVTFDLGVRLKMGFNKYKKQQNFVAKF